MFARNSLTILKGEIPEEPDIFWQGPALSGGKNRTGNTVDHSRSNFLIPTVMQTEKKEIRPHELERYKSIWLTKETYQLLRREKPTQEKSMMRLVD